MTVPADASAVKSVVLTATGSAAHLPQDPVAAAEVIITAPVIVTPVPSLAPLSVSSLPGIPTPSPALSPGGNAAGLFPTLQPSPEPSPSRKTSPARTVIARPVANTSALPEGSPAVGAQLVGLAALGLALVLAVTRVSIRRRVPARAIPTETSADPADEPGASLPADGPDES